MNEEIKKPASEQDFLQQELLAGRIKPDVFLDQLTELDQRNPTRSDAPINLKLLENDRIKELFAESKFQSEYYDLLSLTYFHVAQRKCYEKSEGAYEDFVQALRAAERVVDGYDEWVAYIQATIAYFDKDIEALKKLKGRIESDLNRSIVQRFIDGLLKRGEIDYLNDYLGDN